VRDVPDPLVSDGDVLVDVVRVGLCGTDADIERGEFGTAPEGADVLVLGHESFGRVAHLITRRVPLADAASALRHDPSQIKTVVEVAR
jgi:threonine dehydrogenase-like Zn-dependent dehydrogenase